MAVAVETEIFLSALSLSPLFILLIVVVLISLSLLHLVVNFSYYNDDSFYCYHHYYCQNYINILVSIILIILKITAA